MNWQWIVGPLTGGLIGYITNDIAVRMLFRPRNPVLLFGRKLPFTPGLIPKERGRIARAISDLVSRELLSPEILAKSLLSESMRGQMDQALDAGLAYIEAETRTPRALINGSGDGAALQGHVERLSQSLAKLLCDKLLSSGFETELSGRVIRELRDRLLQSPVSPLRLFWDDRLTATLTDKLAHTLREMLESQGPGLLEGLVRGAANDGLDTPVAELYGHIQPHVPALREALYVQYEKAVREQLGRLLSAVNIAAIVEDRINGLDIVELENLLLMIMKKELRVIVWLGVPLGAIMGILSTVWSMVF